MPGALGAGAGVRVATHSDSDGSDDAMRLAHVPHSRCQRIMRLLRCVDVRQAHDGAVQAIIRPPRFEYTTAAMGPELGQLPAGNLVMRRDFHLRNEHGHRIACSWWRAVKKKPKTSRSHSSREGLGNESVASSNGSASTSEREGACAGVVVFVHGNSSCRLDALALLEPLLHASQRYQVVAFDSSGSGLSDGDWVTLGWQEARDLAVVLSYVRRRVRSAHESAVQPAAASGARVSDWPVVTLQLPTTFVCPRL